MTNSLICTQAALRHAICAAASPGQLKPLVKVDSRGESAPIRMTRVTCEGSRMSDRYRRWALIVATFLSCPAAAQDKGTVDPKPLPPLANPSDPKTPARELFGRAKDGAPMDPEPVGF